MAVVSITRLRLRSWRFLPSFVVYSFRAAKQTERTRGFLGGWLGGSGRNTYWTVTLWTDEGALRAFRDNDAHRIALPKLLIWCDEAAVARYETSSRELPDAKAVLDALTKRGRTSKVRWPSADHSAGRTAPDGRVPRAGRRLTPAPM